MASKSEDFRMKLLNFGYAMGFTVFRWDSSAQVLRISPSRIRSAWIKIQLLLVLIYELFLVYQVAKSTRAESGLDLFKTIYLSVLWTALNCGHIGSIWTSEYVDLMNKLSEYKAEFKSRK